jgi:hypothetical protein
MCGTLHRSYVNSVCGRYSAIADNGQPERTKCVRMSLTLAQPCRRSCREWAPTSLAENKCVTCFQGLIACSIGRESPDRNDIRTRCRRNASQRLRTVRPAGKDRRAQNLRRLMQAGRSSSEYPRQRRTSRFWALEGRSNQTRRRSFHSRAAPRMR